VKLETTIGYLIIRGITLVYVFIVDLLFMQIYDEREMLKGKLDLLSNTNMVDFVMDVHRTLYPDKEVPQSKFDVFQMYFRRCLLK